jgi:cation transport regulator ChaB
MKHLNSEHLSMVAAMLYSAVEAVDANQRVQRAVDEAKALIIQSAKVANEHNKDGE